MTAIPLESSSERLAQRMQRLGVRETDLEEWFVRSGGPGGQRLNKVATCVVLRHRPSGLEVRCQQERSQARNRLIARWRLLHHLEAERARRQQVVTTQLAKIRRQRRRRSLASKERMLAEKRRRSQLKTLRHRPQGLE